MIKDSTKEEDIEKAILFLFDCVRENCRNPKPLIWHSLKVGCKLYELNQSKEVIIAGILHDLIEDTDCKIKQIENRFGSKVAKLVLACTFDRAIRDYKKRWHKSMANIKKAGQKAMIIKVVDANANLPFIPLIKDSNKLKETLWKHQLIIKSFKPKISHLQIFKEYQDNLKKIIYACYKN